MKLLIWDFDGTLGYRAGGAWTASLLEVVQREVPNSPVTSDDLWPYTQSGFPWLEPEVSHPQLTSADGWWAALEENFEAAYRGVGFSAVQAHDLARQVRATYLAPDRWRLYDDAVPTLTRLRKDGWTHAMLTNHVPELPEIAARLGLAHLFARIFNSAQTGYEKPHPQAFRQVLEAFAGAGPRWMIGDSYGADILGATAAGIPAVLVRRYHSDVEHFVETLDELPGIIAGGELS